MTTEQEKLVKQALFQIGMCEVRHYESLPVMEHTFSERFERKMQKLIRTQKSSFYPFIKTPKRKVAVVLFAVILLFSLSLSVSAIGKPIFSAFERITEKFVEIILPKSEKQTIFTKYQPEWIPENFELYKADSNVNSYNTEWRYLESYICLEQEFATHVHYDKEGVTIYKVKWADKTVSYFEKHGTYLFSWETEDYLFTLNCTTDIPLSDIQRMIESIRPVGEGSEG